MQPMSLESSFPNLRANGFETTSEASAAYNCIAWAAGEGHGWWWPDEDGYWPAGVERVTTLESFVKAYATLGYRPCDSDELVEGYEKVAIYAKGDRVTHAARQLGSGRWSSKLGSSVDIEHTLEGLEGSLYGGVVRILSRPASE